MVTLSENPQMAGYTHCLNTQTCAVGSYYVHVVPATYVYKTNAESLQVYMS